MSNPSTHFKQVDSQALVTIITIVLNGEEHIKETIDSVVSQNYKHIEYIIIDGGSSDSTLERIAPYKSRLSAIISEQDKGIYNAINKGLSLASGVIIGILHCGDRYAPGAIDAVVDKYLKTAADVIYGDMITSDNNIVGFLPRVYRSDHRLLHRYMSIFHPATFVTRRCYSLNGYYNENYKSASDYEYFLKLSLKGTSFERVDMVLASFSLGGLSTTNLLLTLKENARIRQDNIGTMNAINYVVTHSVIRYYLVIRRWLIVTLISEARYNSLKHILNEIISKRKVILF